MHTLTKGRLATKLRLLETRHTTALARLANAGEFSERAFLNDKIDLAQAEAIADLIDSQTAQAARAAVRALDAGYRRAGPAHDIAAAVADALHRRAAAFGEGLQLVNILKDSASDAGEGRNYLPSAIDRERVFPEPECPVIYKIEEIPGLLGL